MENKEFSKLEIKAINVAKKVSESFSGDKFHRRLSINYEPSTNSFETGELKIQYYFNEKGKKPYLEAEVILKNNQILKKEEYGKLWFVEHFLKEFNENN